MEITSMTKATALRATLTLLAACWCAAAGGASIGATLTPAKDSYVVGDPVELILTLTNSGTEDVGCEADYPFYGRGHTGLSVWPAGAPEGGKVPPPAGNLIGSHIVVFQPVPAGGSWSFRIFLSRFVGSVGVGTHRLRYSIDIPCYGMDSQGPVSALTGRPAPNPQRRSTLLAEGELPIEVKSDADDRFAEVVKRYIDEFQGNPDFWIRRSAAEALSLMDSPLVLPSLRWVLEHGWADLGVLAKFRGNPDAEELLRTRIRTGGIDQLPSAIPLLRQWKYVLDAADFGTLLSRGNWDLKIPAFRYAEDFGNASYIPIVESYAGDSEDATAKEAQRVAASLRRSGK